MRRPAGSAPAGPCSTTRASRSSSTSRSSVATHLYEPETELTDTGVSPVLFYDPVVRVVATLHPDHTYEKATFDPWRQSTYDPNDTVAPRGLETGDPRTDPDIAGFVEGYFESEPAGWETWYAERAGAQPGTEELDAATKAAAHADTPTVEYLDTLGRPFMTVAHNRYERNGAVVEEQCATRTELDVEGNQRAVSDERTNAAGALEQRVVMRYDYDLLRTRIHQSSMEAGERWMLNDVTGKQVRAWDSRRFLRRTTYDELRRPTGLYVTDACRSRTPRRAHRVRRGAGRRGEPPRPRLPGLRRCRDRHQRRLRLQGQPSGEPTRARSGVGPADRLAPEPDCERRDASRPGRPTTRSTAL